MNGAGRKTSPTFGFGLLDANEFVNIADQWPAQIPERIQCTYSTGGLVLHISTFLYRILDVSEKEDVVRGWGRGDSIIFRIWLAADPCRSGTKRFRYRTVPSSKIKCQESGDFMCGDIRAKKLFLAQTLHRSSSVTHELAKLLTFYFTTRDRPWSKSHGPWPSGIGGPWNPKSLNLP